MADITTEKRLGKGVYSEVFLVQNTKLKEFFALKKTKIENNEFTVNSLVEIDVHAKIHSPYVMSARSVFTEPKYINIMFDVMEGTLVDLLENIRKKSGDLTFEQKKSIWWQISCGIYHLNASGIATGDLSHSNILYRVQNGQIEVKLNDFGLSVYVDPNGFMANNIGQTVYAMVYRAPEIYRVKWKPVSIKCDTWGLALVWMFMFMPEETVLVSGDTKRTVNEVIKSGNLGPLDLIMDRVPDGQKESCKDLLTRMFEVNPNDRISIYDVVRHPFFYGFKVQGGYVNSDSGSGIRLNELQISKLKDLLTDRRVAVLRCDIVFLFVDLVHRLAASVNSSKENIMEALLKIATVMINFETTERLPMAWFPLIEELGYIIYRPYLFEIARNDEDLKTMVPYLYAPTYPDIDIEALKVRLALKSTSGRRRENIATKYKAFQYVAYR